MSSPIEARLRTHFRAGHVGAPGSPERVIAEGRRRRRRRRLSIAAAGATVLLVVVAVAVPALLDRIGGESDSTRVAVEGTTSMTGPVDDDDDPGPVPSTTSRTDDGEAEAPSHRLGAGDARWLGEPEPLHVWRSARALGSGGVLGLTVLWDLESGRLGDGPGVVRVNDGDGWSVRETGFDEVIDLTSDEEGRVVALVVDGGTTQIATSADGGSTWESELLPDAGIEDAQSVAVGEGIVVVAGAPSGHDQSQIAVIYERDGELIAGGRLTADDELVLQEVDGEVWALEYPPFDGEGFEEIRAVMAADGPTWRSVEISPGAREVGRSGDVLVEVRGRGSEAVVGSSAAADLRLVDLLDRQPASDQQLNVLDIGSGSSGVAILGSFATFSEQELWMLVSADGEDWMYRELPPPGDVTVNGFPTVHHVADDGHIVAAVDTWDSATEEARAMLLVIDPQ